MMCRPRSHKESMHLNARVVRAGEYYPLYFGTLEGLDESEASKCYTLVRGGVCTL